MAWGGGWFGDWFGRWFGATDATPERPAGGLGGVSVGADGSTTVTVGGCCNCGSGSGGSGGSGPWSPGTPTTDDCSAAVFTCSEDGDLVDYLGCVTQTDVYCLEMTATPGTSAIQTLGTDYTRFYVHRAVSACNYWVACPALSCDDPLDQFPGDPTSTPDCRLFADPTCINQTVVPGGTPPCHIAYFGILGPYCQGAEFKRGASWPSVEYTLPESSMVFLWYGDDFAQGLAIYTKPLSTWSCNGSNTLDLVFQSGSFSDYGLPASITLNPCGIPTCLSGMAFLA